MPNINIEFFLSGRVNGQDFEMNGVGYGNRENGTCELHLCATPAFPAGFDPVSCPLICSHPTSSFFARPEDGTAGLSEVSNGLYSVSPAREGVIRNSAGEELLRLQVIGSTSLEAGKLVVRNVMEGVSRLPKLRRIITPLTDYIIPNGLGEATGIVRYKLETVDGELLDGLTTIPYKWGSLLPLPAVLERHIEKLNVAWDGENQVSAFYTLSLSSLFSKGEKILA